MIVLEPGSYTKREIEKMDLGTNGLLPTMDQDIIISNPAGYGIPSYRISKEKLVATGNQSFAYFYVITEI